jgi:hypothetical protein
MRFKRFLSYVITLLFVVSPLVVLWQRQRLYDWWSLRNYGDLKAAADRLAEIEQANASELEKAQGKLSKAEQAAASAEAKLLRYEVANDKEVPAKLVPLLTATTKEDLEAQADLILENAKPANPDFDGGTREPTPDPLTPEQQHSKLLLQMAGIEPQ